MGDMVHILDAHPNAQSTVASYVAFAHKGHIYFLAASLGPMVYVAYQCDAEFDEVTWCSVGV